MKGAHRSLDDWLEDIRSNADKIVQHTSAISYEDFLANEPVRDLVTKKIENMGEAAKRIRDFFPAFHAATALPMMRMARMRDRIAHGYFDLKLPVVWDTALTEIPDLLLQVEAEIARRASAAPSP